MTNILQTNCELRQTCAEATKLEIAPGLSLQKTPERLLAPREVAARLGVSERWVRDHATRRYPRIAVVKLGPLLRFRPEDVAQFIAEQRVDNFQVKPRYR